MNDEYENDRRSMSWRMAVTRTFPTITDILAYALLELLIAEHGQSRLAHERETAPFFTPDSRNTLDIVEKPSVHPPVRNRKRPNNGPENEGG